MSGTFDEDYRVWRRLAPLGLLLVGAGTAVAADASARRTAGARTAAWVGEGTGGLVLLNAGLSVFGEAVKRRALHDAAQRSVVDLTSRPPAGPQPPARPQ